MRKEIAEGERNGGKNRTAEKNLQRKKEAKENRTAEKNLQRKKEAKEKSNR